MHPLIRLVNALRNNRRAVTALEYGLIAGAISLAIVHSVSTLGTKISGIFNSLSSANW
jgi:pilus assembly protein Flp/PilA